MNNLGVLSEVCKLHPIPLGVFQPVALHLCRDIRWRAIDSGAYTARLRRYWMIS